MVPMVVAHLVVRVGECLGLGDEMRTKVSNLINFESEWQNADVSKACETTVDLEALMNKGLQVRLPE
eukprot:3864792-Amphidinium_carterae.1